MKLNSSFFIRNLFSVLLLFCVAVFLYSCAAVGKAESPIQGGAAVHIAPGIIIGDSKFSAHAVLGYEKIWFKGGNGRQHVFMVGGQGRYSLSDDPNGLGLWCGGEAAYLLLKNRYDNSPVKPSASGFSLAALAGYRFSVADVPLSVYIAPGFFNRGKFSNNFAPSGGGFHGRVGIDIHFASLLCKRGR